MTVLIRRGLWDGLRPGRAPIEVRRAFEELGPTFVKIGQILSSRPDLLSEAYVNEFRRLRDDVQPEDFSKIRAVIENELGRPIEAVFESFDPVPLASASMAQAHRAVLPSGRTVVVKVQRPGIAETMQMDLRILRRLAFVAKRSALGAVIDLQQALDELWSSTKRELDFTIEADNIEHFARCNRDVRFLAFPGVVRELTTPRVLVMDYIRGIRVNDVETLRQNGYDPGELAKKLVDNYFKQVFHDGFFHADPHPGNILVRENHVVYIDFGIMGTLTESMQERLNGLLFGVALQDPESMTRAIQRLCKRTGPTDARKLEEDVEQVYSLFAGTPLEELNVGQLTGAIVQAARKNHLSFPREVVLLVRGLVALEGVVAELAPGLSILEFAAPYVRTRKQLGRDLREILTGQLQDIYSLSRQGLKIPLRLAELLNRAISGRLKVQSEFVDLDRAVGELNRMVNRLVFGLIVTGLIVASSLLVNARAGPLLFDMPVFGFIGYLGAAVMGFWLLISILRSGKI